MAADTPIFHEIGQDSVLYFNPDSPQEAAAHINHLASPSANREYVKKGRNNAARYTWQASATSAAEIINRL